MMRPPSHRLPTTRPPELSALLDAATPGARARAWDAFVAAYSKVILHAVRSVHRDHDPAMDAYAFILQKLSDDDCRRLKAFTADGTGKFTTWLVVVARRLAHDWHRERYGRAAGGARADAAREEHSARRRLVDLTAEAIDLDRLPDTGSQTPDVSVVMAEMRAALSAEIDALSATDRLLIKLRFEDNLSAKEIAEVVDAATPFHVYRRLNHILAVLRRGLVARGLESALP
jgi:RNA polymerase sigma factor (sigma-70 family)